MDELRPKIGIGIMVIKDGKVLFGKRIGAHGEGEYSFPGGHLEHGESIIECGKRETLEETGVVVGNVRLLCVSNEKRYMPKHYVNIGLVADWVSGEPIITEPDKFVEVGWYSMDQLPSPLFEVSANYFKAYQDGTNLFDY